ncbi:thioredoxin domain-containing protein [Paenibacillus fonticola]|uniref:thioredoxin domain-containing protein n=1 Tax=Paenibacillus fonticola TaxID=379896 RepID=UPI000367ECAA|nr:thioredoxin domain-containing protein [Paenibacillus fonticola]
MKQKKMGLITLAAIALLALAIVLFVSIKGSRQADAEFPDFSNVTVEHVPEGFNEAEQPSIGDKGAPVTIVEFSDYKCPACKRWNEEVLLELKREYLDTGKAVLYYVDYPFLAPDSNLAALAGETLYQQNEDFFWIYHHKMSELQGKKDETWATKKFILNLVRTHIPEADIVQFEQDLDSRTYIENVKKDLMIVERHEVMGTPTVFVNGKEVEDASFAGIQFAIENP